MNCVFVLLITAAIIFVLDLLVLAASGDYYHNIPKYTSDPENCANPRNIQINGVVCFQATVVTDYLNATSPVPGGGPVTALIEYPYFYNFMWACKSWNSVQSWVNTVQTQRKVNCLIDVNTIYKQDTYRVQLYGYDASEISASEITGIIATISVSSIILIGYVIVGVCFWIQGL